MVIFSPDVRKRRIVSHLGMVNTNFGEGLRFRQNIAESGFSEATPIQVKIRNRTKPLLELFLLIGAAQDYLRPKISLTAHAKKKVMSCRSLGAD